MALIGDFNSLLSNPGIVYLTGKAGTVAGSTQSWANGFSDAYQTLHAGEKGRSTTLHLWRGSREGEAKIDHILLSRGAKIEAAEIVSEDKPMVSDHFPVTARVLFPLTK